MANHKSAEKAHRKSLKRASINRARRSRIKTFIKKVEVAIAAGNNDDARKVLSHAQSEIMRGVTKKVLSLGTASRMVKKLAAKVKAMAA
ncbi:MAG: 30S ribosomal protein S20 [Sphingobacteriia bacterium]|nr:30S ribosomal protein S20 [Sphingobacteriia bacterium]